MPRTMFPFDDSFRVTFSGTLLPTQNREGKILPVNLPDPRFQVLALDEAPKSPFWRKKDSNKSTSGSSSSSSSTETPSPTSTSTPAENNDGRKDDEQQSDSRESKKEVNTTITTTGSK